MTDQPRNNGRPRRNWRNRPAARPGPPARLGADDDGPEEARPRAPTMSRSRAQLASTYAPGVLFTWEGAKGICRAVPIDREAPPVSDATRALIFDGIMELASNWLERGAAVRRPDHETPIRLILDDPFYNQHTLEVELNRVQDFQLSDPGIMGYVPYPLLYRCATCGHLQEYESIDDQDRHRLPARCHDHPARWTQVDVVYVHWSGNLEPLSPFKNVYDANQGTAAPIRVCECGSRDFRLRSQSPVFAEWRFVCESCQTPRDLQQKDRLTLEVLEDAQRNGGRQFERIEVNMLPVSYRANSAFYPQKSAFIEFNDRCVVDLMLPQRQGELLHRVADQHGFAYAVPSDAGIEAALAATGRAGDWANYADHLMMANNAAARGDEPRTEQWRRSADALKSGWLDDGVVNRGQVQSASLALAVADRAGWARRYDPIRLTIEHERFRIEQIEERRGRHEAINVMEPDRLICSAAGDNDAEPRYRATIGGLLERIGVDELVLIRGLPICEFSFGFTRVSASPVHVREFAGRRVPMPVRLNAFPQLPNRKHPVYVTQQKNEALYFRVDQRRVRNWLSANGITDVPDDGKTLGAAYLESYSDFGPFLDEFKQREGRGSTQRSLSAYTYLLLHSLSHQVMHALADVSGLDRDGLGEYLFPADNAFVVYRKGMTPDLGNVSAMWRNHAAEFLRRMLDARQLRCGSGNLCDQRGGACPACIMVSEVTCLAGNQLLSRAALRGGPAPTWEPTDATPLVGFFDPQVAP